MRTVVWNEPMFTDSAPYCNTVRRMSEEDVILYYRRIHPVYRDLPEALALLDFMTVNWAWFDTEDKNPERV